MHPQCATCPYRPKKRAKSEREKCKTYEVCEAIFCPLDPNSLGIWYVGEEICRDRSHKNLLWVQAQRKLAKVKAEGYFTMAMLKQDCFIKAGIHGLDPDKEERHQLRLWLKNHPAKQRISDGDREKRRELMKKIFDEKTGPAIGKVRTRFQSGLTYGKFEKF